MKILLVSPYYIDSYRNHLTMGSAVKLAQNLSSYYQVKVLTTGRKLAHEVVTSKLDITSSPGILIPDPVNYMISFQLLFSFLTTLDSFHPDLVIVSKYMFFSSFVIPIARLKGYPVITVTDTFPGINWFSQSKLTAVIMWFYARVIGVPLLKISNQVVLLYPGLEEIARRYKLNFVTIPNGVESKYLHKLPPPPDINKPSGEFWIGFVGRPESAKGYTTAMEIAEKLKHDHQIKIIFVGGNEPRREQANKIYLGFRKDIMHVYQLFDLLILPSRAEGLPNVVMESMAQGTPVIGSAVGGVTYVIKDGQNGILVKPQDIDGFVKNILLLKNDKPLLAKLGFEAKNSISRNYNWDKILVEYSRIFQKLCVA
jgi:glycosyltransferase involved in cell wall biosynthesis